MNRLVRISTLIAGSIAAASVTISFAAEDYIPPKTAFGVPDVQGVWNFKTRTSL